MKFGIDERLSINGLKPYLDEKEGCCNVKV